MGTVSTEEPLANPVHTGKQIWHGGRDPDAEGCGAVERPSHGISIVEAPMALGAAQASPSPVRVLRHAIQPTLLVAVTS